MYTVTLLCWLPLIALTLSHTPTHSGRWVHMSCGVNPDIPYDTRTLVRCLLPCQQLWLGLTHQRQVQSVSIDSRTVERVKHKVKVLYTKYLEGTVYHVRILYKRYNLHVPVHVQDMYKFMYVQQLVYSNTVT